MCRLSEAKFAVRRGWHLSRAALRLARDFCTIGWFEFPVESFARLAFVLKANIVILLWPLSGVGMVSTIRRYFATDICGSAYAVPSERLAISVAFLQNTLEQAFIAVLALLALVTLKGDARQPSPSANAHDQAKPVLAFFYNVAAVTCENY